jgi:large subunit ribosomal protein L11e
MDFYVVLARPGMRIARRKRAVGRVGPQHLITKDDAMHWFVDRYQGTIF